MIRGNTVGSPVPDLRSGMTMAGDIDMNGRALTGLKEPAGNTDAVTKQYAESFAQNYADSLHKLFTVSVPAANWSASAPYTQTVTLSGILATDTPHWSVVYSTDTATALTEKEAFSLVDDLDTAADSVSFTCFEEKPEVDLNIQLEVNR